jgi:hypothetical protein
LWLSDATAIGYPVVMRRHLTLTLTLCLAALPAPAQEGGGDVTEGLGLIEEGAQRLLRGLLTEIEPAVRDFGAEIEPRLRGLAQDLGPMLEELSALIGDIDQYHPPERLPNGDILLRRKVPDAVPPPAAPAPGGQIDL